MSSKKGAQYIEDCSVDMVVTENGAVKGVQTKNGFISCEYFVNCAGMVWVFSKKPINFIPEFLIQKIYFQWAREVGSLCTTKVRVPVQPAEHFYVTTNPLPGVTHDLPYIRDFDSSIYIREFNGGFMVGGFEPNAKPAFVNYRTIPENWKSNVPADWQHFSEFLWIS